MTIVERLICTRTLSLTHVLSLAFTKMNFVRYLDVPFLNRFQIIGKSKGIFEFLRLKA